MSKAVRITKEKKLHVEKKKVLPQTQTIVCKKIKEKNCLNLCLENVRSLTSIEAERKKGQHPCVLPLT